MKLPDTITTFIENLVVITVMASVLAIIITSILLFLKNL